MIDKKQSDWLNALKPGDKVAYRSSRDFYRRASIYTIERLTATQIVTGHNSPRFRRSDGAIVGEGYGRIEPVTDEIREQIERADLLTWLYRTEQNAKSLKTETLLAMKAAAEGAEK